MVKLQIAAGKATPAPPVGTALGPHGVNIMDFCKNFNAKTAKDEGLIIPVVVTVYADRSYTFITKTPPAPMLLKRAANIAKGSAEPNKTKVGTVTQKQVEEIAKLKMPDLNCESLEAGDQVRRRHRAVDGHRRHRVDSGIGSRESELGKALEPRSPSPDCRSHDKSGRPRRRRLHHRRSVHAEGTARNSRPPGSRCPSGRTRSRKPFR